MSSSFQSTAATNIYDSPVNTFVQPVRVLPKTGIMDLAETLASINTNLRPFLNQEITKGVEKEKRRATKDRIFAEINGGEVAKLSNDIRKKDGNDAAINGLIIAFQKLTICTTNPRAARPTKKRKISHHHQS